MPLLFRPIPNEAEAKLRAEVRSLLDLHVKPFVLDDDTKCFFRRQAFRELASRGLTSLMVPKEYGGRGEGHTHYYACLEEIGRVSLSLGVTVGVTNLVQGALMAFGTQNQKETLLPKLSSGEMLGAFSLSEPQAGSDAAGLVCSAKKVAGGYSITGTKSWCSTAGNADIYLLMARTGEHRIKGASALLVPANHPGFRIGKQEKKLGLHSSSLAELIFEDCFIPSENLLGPEGAGLTVALSQLDAGRITIGTLGAGAAIEVLERGWKQISQSRNETAESSMQALAEYYARIQAVKLLVQEAAHLRDRREKITVLASQVKLLGSDLAMQISSDMLHWTGHWGADPKNGIERVFRDAKALQIVEGTNQIQKMVLAREIGGMLS